mmetsp:Transcript_9024/g.22749  ORF Transcript_9024/g.22749 Transcript_9024/m.22749 type:complete len:440 (-) Transcript_9024:335-1654(-)
MTELDMVCNDAESQLQAGAAVVTAAAPQVDGGQGGELHALLGQGGQQRPAWLRRVSLAAGAAALLLVGVGTRYLGRGGTAGGQGLTLSGGAATGVTQFHESKEECSLHGGAYNCIETECCKGPHMVCFEKNEHYATCRESCVVGEHHDDPEEHRTPWSCKPLNKDSDTDSAPRGSTITLKSHHGKYVVADRFHGRWVKADREEADMWASFKVEEQDDHTVALLSHHQDYIFCEPDGDLRADRTAVNTWEKFIWIDNSDGTVSLLCGHTGKYVKATPDGVLKAEAHLIGDWEKFTFEVDDTPDRCGDRWARLKQYGTTTVYHQTSPELGRSIMQTGFNPNYGEAHASADIAGAATYFATDLRATNWKAWHKGFCIEVKVYLGHPKEEPRHPHSGLSLEFLNSQCYDSVHIDRGYEGGDEYAVYAADQMPRSLYKHVDCLH